jgi:hypothetical protein
VRIMLLRLWGGNMAVKLNVSGFGAARRY